MCVPKPIAFPKNLKIDHVTFAGPELAPLQQTFAELGLATDYGGPHSNGITHMALLGFRDGSYIELISSLVAGQKDQAFWGEHIVGNGGPCAWAVEVEDVAVEAARVANLGIPVDGPAYYHRRRPDGKLVEWDLAFLDDKGAGAVLPFIIKDITPRRRRVRPSTSVLDGPLTGLSRVVVGVRDLEAAVALFQRAYGWDTPAIIDQVDYGARLAHFEDTPVVLATPAAGQGWLAERLARFGDSPCAYLIGADDFAAAYDQFGLSRADRWFNRPVAWFDPSKLNGFTLGITGV